MKKNDDEHIDFAKFGKAFIDYYLQNGFGSRNKSDMDCEIYSLMCDCGKIDDSLPSITLGLELKTTAAVINNCRQYRFYQHKLSTEMQNKEVLKVLRDNLSSISREKWLLFTVHNVATRLHLENILQEKGKTYDYSFNSNNIKLNVQTFIELYTAVGGDFDEVVEKALKNKKFLNEYPDIAKELKVEDVSITDKIKNVVGIIADLATGALAFKTLFGF